MKKLVTALFIVLPLIFLVAIFAVTSFARIAAQIPAAALTINNKSNDGSGVFHFDMAKDGISPIDESELGIEVLPLGATNRKFSLRSILTPGTDEPADCVTREEDGSFVLHGIGDAVLTYASDDGGFTDSVIFSVTASDVTGFTPHIYDANEQEQPLVEQEDGNYAVTLKSGNYTLSNTYVPEGSQPSFTRFATSSVGIEVNEVTGAMTALFSGESWLSVSAGSIASPKNIRVNVEKAGEVTVNGIDAETSPRFGSGISDNFFTFCLETGEGVTADMIEVSNQNVDSAGVTVTPVADKSNCFIVKCPLKTKYEASATEQYSLSVNGANYSFRVDFAEYEFEVRNAYAALDSGALMLFEGGDAIQFVVFNKQNVKLQYKWEIVENGASFVQIEEQNNEYCKIKPLAVGDATLKISWWDASSDIGTSAPAGVIERSVRVIKGYSSLTFTENSASFGLGKQAIARYEYNAEGNLIEKRYYPGLVARELYSAAATDVLSGGEFTSSNDSVVRVGEENGKMWLQVVGDGFATVTASWNYGGRTLSASFAFNAVDGVWANDDASLRRAMSDRTAVVLEKDVYLGEQLFNVQRDENGNVLSRTAKYPDAEMKRRLLSYVDEIDSTWDCKYLDNVGAPHKLKYALELTANVHGNGHFINAEYITNMLDSTGQLPDYAVFRGPLDFVATSTHGISAAVKGQDNICFLARTDGIAIDNVTLKGCDDSSIYDSEGVELSYLNYVGTVLELMCDASLTNSRVNNGRTVLRAFGRYGIAESSAVDPASERIHVTIDGCVLSYAREFILKIGTNRVKRGSYADSASSLFDASGREYAHNSGDCDDLVNDSYFMDNYVLTDVTLKDSVLSTSGLFTVGIESHFSGTALQDGEVLNMKLDGWENVAATSYPTILRMVGNVELRDWKVLANIDSSTLIETDLSSDKGGWLSLNIAAMLDTVCKNYPDDYGNIILDKSGTKYVHGGIAMYGGGKNYSIVDFSGYTGAIMDQYNINLEVLAILGEGDLAIQGSTLPFAAGQGDFRFFMFGANSAYLPE